MNLPLRIFRRITTPDSVTLQDGSIEGTEREPAASILLPDWVNALTVRKGTKEKIVAGCTDGVIYVMAWDGGEEGAGKFAVEK